MSGYNLLPWREHSKQCKKKKYSLLWLGALIFTLILLILEYKKFSWQLTTTINHNNYILANMAMNNAKLAANTRMSRETVSDAATRSFIEQLRASQHKDMMLYQSLMHDTPSEVYLLQISRQNDEIILQGRARSTAAVFVFTHKLTERQLCKTIKLREIFHDNNVQDYQKQFSLALSNC